jgi:L-malate glycosyltransferase
MRIMHITRPSLMACGKPVIATRHRGCEDVVVDGQTGFLIPIKQAAILADKILSLLDNEQLRTQMGRAGRQQVELYFGLAYCNERIIDAIEKGCEK